MTGRCVCVLRSRRRSSRVVTRSAKPQVSRLQRRKSDGLLGVDTPKEETALPHLGGGINSVVIDPHWVGFQSGT